MQISKKFIVVLLLAGLGFMGFQCTSTELTSAKLYLQQKNYDKALESLKKEVEKNPKSDEGYYWLGLVYAEKENIEEMVKAFDASLSISKKFESNIKEAKYQTWIEQFNKGAGYFQRGINSVDKDSSKLYYEKSILQFENAILLEPDSANTYKNLAFVYRNAGREDEAIKPLQKIIELEKEIDGYVLLGEIYYNKGAVLSTAYSTSSNLSDSLAFVEQYNKAIDILEEGRKTYPDDQNILILLSNSYIGAGRSNEALDIFRAGVENDPENENYRYNYGVLLLGTEQYEAASTQFLKAIELNPEYQNAIYNLGVTYVKWGTKMNLIAEEKGQMTDEFKEKYKLALPYLEKVVEMDSTDAPTWLLLGRVYGVLGMPEKAKDALDKADELNK